MGKAFLMGMCVLSLVLSCGATAQAGDVMVDRKGYQLQAEQQGEGSVVVVFESGFGQDAGVWKDVIAELGAECHCIARLGQLRH